MIAISYRREDSLVIAGRLYDRLQAKFGKKNVFMDFDSIPPGVDFRDHIRQTIERADLVVAVIGPHWLGEKPKSKRRIDEANDFVRLEIAYALERGIPIIPVLVGNTEMPKAEKLPPDLEALAFRNALPLDTGRDFHHHAERLISGISQLRDLKRKPAVFQKKSESIAQTTVASESSSPGKNPRRVLMASVAVGVVILIVGLGTWYFITAGSKQRGNEVRRTENEDKNLQPTSTVSAPATLALASVAPQSAPRAGTSLLSPSPSIPAKTPAAPSISEATQPAPEAMIASTASSPKPKTEQAVDQNASEPKLQKIYVKKYRVSALIPVDVFSDAQKLSDTDADFLQGTSWSNQTTLTFSSAKEPLAKAYAECATEHSPQNPSKTVGYKVSKPTWFVVSGDFGPEADTSMGFYTKGVKKGDGVVLMHLQWREDDFPFSEKTFTAMSRGFDGN